MKPREIVPNAIDKVYKTLASSPAEQLVLLPPRTAKAVFGHARRMVAETTELFFPTKTQREFAEELASEHIRERAAHAIEEIEIGKQAQQSTIEFMGRASLAEVTIEADAAKVIPDEVTEEILELAIEAEVDPDFEPLLDNEKQNKLKEVFRRHNTVQDMFRYRKNKL